MKIIIATDSFKGSLSAKAACKIISNTLREFHPNFELIEKPLADGGEGTSDAIMNACGGQWIPKKVMGPLPNMKVDAGFAWIEDSRTALVEMAAASGIVLLTKKQLMPLKTTTYGTGQLIKAAMNYDAQKILLAVGGSATIDGGVGAAQAVGWKFLNKNHKLIGLGGNEIGKIEMILEPDIRLPPIEVLCDVDNPLCGEHGAAIVYGPQKGADPVTVKKLENNLLHLAWIIREHLNKNIIDIPRTGAAGGLAGGAMAFLKADLVSGIDVVIKKSQLKTELSDTDWIITGEGLFDKQSLRGKVLSGIINITQKTDVKIAVIAGHVSVKKEEYEKYGIYTAISCQKKGMSLNYAIKNSEKLLKKATTEFSNNWF